ncbi:P-loop containing nucleoside triphosphate hydrolase protein, partial [Gloeophyllum trabeum ATCC 11539]
MSSSSEQKWTFKRIRDLVQAKLGKRPCLWQMKVALALYEGKKDVVAVAPTGAGKTLSFWIPLLMVLEDGQDKTGVIITPLNLLGKQSAESELLARAGISGDVEAGKHRVLVVNPEILSMEGGHFERLWKKSAFTSKLLYFAFDEGHCVSTWSEFRNKYKYMANLRYLISEAIPFYVTSATLPDPILHDVVSILQLHPKNTEYICRSNDRPDIHLAVHRMLWPANSFRDLDFIIKSGFKEGDPPPPKFLIFFDARKETEAAVKHLRSRLPESLRGKIKYFHSVMTSEYREDEYNALRDDEIWGLCVTDAFGMGLDLPDVKLIIQYRVTCDANTLWQRFGRGARGDGQEGIAVLFAEKSFFDSERAKAAEKRAKKPKKRKPRTQKVKDSNAKRARIAPTTSESHASEDEDDPDADTVYLEPLKRDETTIRNAQSARLLHPVMDDFINAPTRGFLCRRKPMSLFFSNDKRGES